MDEELERIRQQKRARLEAQLTDESTDAPIEPISVEGPTHLEELFETHRAVLVDFYADWCGPCQQLAPILERIAETAPVAVAKVDTEAHPQLAQQHGVRGLPTLVLFVDGEPAERLVGMQPESQLRAVIERHVGGES